MTEQKWMTISLSQGYNAIVSIQDSDLNNTKWHVIHSKSRSYATGYENSHHVYMHRIILSRILGYRLSKYQLVDHINGDTLDNRRENLRIATLSQNAMNRKIRRDSKSGFKGVKWHNKTKKWTATIAVDGKYHYLGYYNTPEEAHEAYCEKAKELHGEFANLG